MATYTERIVAAMLATIEGTASARYRRDVANQIYTPVAVDIHHGEDVFELMLFRAYRIEKMAYAPQKINGEKIEMGDLMRERWMPPKSKSFSHWHAMMDGFIDASEEEIGEEIVAQFEKFNKAKPYDMNAINEISNAWSRKYAFTALGYLSPSQIELFEKAIQPPVSIPP